MKTMSELVRERCERNGAAMFGWEVSDLAKRHGVKEADILAFQTAILPAIVADRLVTDAEAAAIRAAAECLDT